MTATEGGYYGWIAVFSCFYHHAFVSSAVYGLSVYYGTWVEDFNTGRGITSWVLTLSMAVSMGTGPIISDLCTRFGHRKVIIIGSVVCAVGFFLSSFATSIYAVVLLIGGLSGFGLGMQYLPSVSIIPFFFNKRRSFAIGVALSGAGVGVFLYPPFLIWLEEQYTWRGAMLILSGVSLNMIVCAALLKPVDEDTLDIRSSNSDADEPCNLSEKQTLQSNCHEDEILDLNGSATGCRLPHFSSKDFYQAVNFSSGNDMRSGQLYSSVSHIEPFALTQDHLANSCHNVHETGSRRSLRQSHVDICLSTSHFNLAEADKKRAADSLHELRPLESRRTNKSSPPSHLDSLLQLSTEVYENSPQTIINASSKRSYAQPNSSQIDKLCSRCLPVKHIELLRNPFFVALAVSFVLICLTSLVPVAYIVDRAVDNGVDKAKAAMAFSMYGAGNLFGRIALGVLADQGLDSLLLCTACLLLIGLSTCLSPLCGTNAILHGAYGLTFGTCFGGFVTLTPLILVDLFGLSMVNRSFGLLLVFMATGFVIGTPIAGWVFDATNSYTISFIFHGAIVVVAAVILVIIKVAVVRSRRRAAAAAAVAVTVTATTTEDNDVHGDVVGTKIVKADFSHITECNVESTEKTQPLKTVTPVGNAQGDGKCDHSKINTPNVAFDTGIAPQIDRDRECRQEL